MLHTANSRSPAAKTPIRKPPTTSKTPEKAQKPPSPLSHQRNPSKVLEICASEILQNTYNLSNNHRTPNKLTRNGTKIPHFSKFEKYLQKSKPEYVVGPQINNDETKRIYKNYEITPRILTKSVNYYPINNHSMGDSKSGVIGAKKKPIQRNRKMRLSKSFEKNAKILSKTGNFKWNKNFTKNISNVYITSLAKCNLKKTYNFQKNKVSPNHHNKSVNVPTPSHQLSQNHQIHSQFVAGQKAPKRSILTNRSLEGHKLKNEHSGNKLNRNVKYLLDKLIETKKRKKMNKKDYKDIFEQVILRHK